MSSMSEEALLYSDLFTQAAALAKERDKIEPECEITEEMMVRYLKKAFPKITDEKAKALAREMFEEPTEQ